MTKEEVQKLKSKTRKGDIKAIAELSGFHVVTVSRFMSGEITVSEDTSLRIIECMEKVFKEREKLAEKAQKILNRIQP